MKLRTKSPKRWQFYSFFFFLLYLLHFPQVCFVVCRTKKKSFVFIFIVGDSNDIGKSSLVLERIMLKISCHLTGKLRWKVLFLIYQKVKCSLKLNEWFIFGIVVAQLLCAVCCKSITMHKYKYKKGFWFVGCLPACMVCRRIETWWK